MYFKAKIKEPIMSNNEQQLKLSVPLFLFP